LTRWLAGPQRCAVVVGHASPLLAILRTALYLPHYPWLRTSTFDRFELAMAAVFALAITPTDVRAEQIFVPEPRILHIRGRQRWTGYPRPVSGLGQNTALARPNFGALIGDHAPRS
jgi:hypothetical protein